MHRNLKTLSVLALSLALAACENKSETTTAPAAKPADAPAAAPAPAAGSGARTVAFELKDEKAVGALQIDVEYKGKGRFVGDHDGVACETLIEGALSSYNHMPNEKMLKAAFVAVKGFTGPVKFSQCKYEGETKADDFKITVRDASSPDLQEIDPAPSVAVTLQ
ncbi:MAG TPA: hypothetical protein VEC57_05400 [Candidatus Limnocylindrales bacterium]|nr:hypothetical protein [Candidatus Limnocylindrales bacterium]